YPMPDTIYTLSLHDALPISINNAQITAINEVRTGLISSTSVGGMDFTEKHYKQYDQYPEYQKYILSHNAGDSSNKIADYLGLKGFVSTISTACSSAANAIMLGASMIENGYLDRVIVGGTRSEEHTSE